MSPLILIVEDDQDLSEFLKDLLTDNNYLVHAVGTGSSALGFIKKTEPNLVLLDLTLPDMDGENVCLDIQKNHPGIPVIMLTGRDRVGDKVRGLTIGADDYMVKPFASEELLARITARLRGSGSDTAEIKIGDLLLDKKKIQVTRAGKQIELTPLEFKLLTYLMENKGAVLSREMILNRIWSTSPDVETRVVDVYIGYLRRKVDEGFKTPLLHSIRGFGYTIKE
jgi:DNA-binding response OmpR family regulator